MNFRVLIIDDQIDSRRPGYDRLKKEIEKTAKLTIDFDFIEQPEEIHLRHIEQYNGVIVDAVLDEYWPTFSLTAALSRLGQRIPIALVSSQWDKTNAEEISRAWRAPNCRTFLLWRDIDPSLEGNIRYAAYLVLGMISPTQGGDTIFLGPNDPFRILHISDLQVGGIDTKRLKLEAQRSAQFVLNQWSAPPTIVAFTGDIAERGLPKEYIQAQEWLKFFFESMEMGDLPSRRLMLVPGNHDVTIALGAASRLTIEKKQKKERQKQIDAVDEYYISINNSVVNSDLLPFAYSPFRQFASATCNRPFLSSDASDSGLAWVEAGFQHLGIIFFGLNTARPASPDGIPDRIVDADSLAKIGGELKSLMKNECDMPPVIIGMGHHSPLSMHGDRGVQNPEEFSTFFSGHQISLFMHGHVHNPSIGYQSNGFPLVWSCASTLAKKSGARPEDSLRGFNLIELDRKDHVVVGMRARAVGWLSNDIQMLSDKKFIRRPDGTFREE